MSNGKEEINFKGESRESLIQRLLAAEELERRRLWNPLGWYMPCCVTHGGRKPDDWPQNEVWHPAKCPSLPKPCPDSKHTRLHVSKARTRIAFGGNRSSKTFTCTKEFLFQMCLKKHPFTGELFREGARFGRMFAQDYSLHEKKTIPDLLEWIPQPCLKMGAQIKNREEAFWASYDSRNHILHLTKGGRIDFLSYDQDTSKGESVDIDVVYADEEMPEDWYGATISRLITRNGVFIMGVTPLYGLTWGMKFLESTDPNVEVFNWEIWDNPHNSKKSVEDFIAQIPEHEREARISGKFIEARGFVYKELERGVHLVEEPQMERTWPVVMAMDPHQRKATVITWAVVTPSDDLVFFDELEIAGTAREVAEAIRAKEATHKAPTLLRLIDPAANKQVSGFGSEVTTLREFQAEGLSFSLADNNEAGYNVVHGYLQYDKAKPLSTLNRPRCYFTHNVPKTWYSMTHLMWDEYSVNRFARDPKERVKDKAKDFPDTVRYTLAAKPTRKMGRLGPVPLNRPKALADRAEIRRIIFGQ